MNHRRIVPIVISPLLINLAAHAQTYIFGRADFAVGSVPTSTASGDFNGDGITDFAVTNSNDNTVSTLLGKPDGTFAPQVAYATGAEPGAMPLACTLILLGLGWLLLCNRKRAPALALPMVILVFASWVGCGGGGGGSSSHTTPGTPPGTYSATITATSGSLDHSMTFTVVVN